MPGMCRLLARVTQGAVLSGLRNADRTSAEEHVPALRFGHNANRQALRGVRRIPRGDTLIRAVLVLKAGGWRRETNVLLDLIAHSNAHCLVSVS